MTALLYYINESYLYPLNLYKTVQSNIPNKTKNITGADYVE